MKNDDDTIIDYKYLLDKNEVWHVYEITGEDTYKHQILEDAIDSLDNDYDY